MRTIFARSQCISLTLALVLTALAQPAAAESPDVSCGMTVEVSIELEHDLTECQSGQNALTIAANGVTIDLKGHKIVGKSRSGVGIDNSGGFRDVAVRGDDGAVSGFGNGISAKDASGLRISNVTLQENAGLGLRLSGVTDGEFSELTVNNNAGGGAWLGDGSSRNAVRDTSFQGNGKAGLVVAGNANVLSGNWANRNAGDGIVVEADATDTRLSTNRAANNKGNGFSIHSASTTVTENSAKNNHKLGISAVNGVHDGGKNSAKANDGATQCTGVACAPA